MSKILKIENIVDSVSITHKFPNPEVIFLNTSDILEGKFLHHDYSKVSTLKGQAKKTIRNGDILFSEIRPKNKRYAFVNVSKPEEYVVSTKLMVLRNKSIDVLTEYFYYFLTYSGTLDYLQMRAENRIGSFPQITFDILKPISLAIPDISIQSKIVKLISAIDKKIELNNRINAELEQMAKTIYDYWFVQFDFPDENGKPYKSSGGKMFWSEKLKKEIPAGWVVENLKNNCLTTLIKPGIDIFEGEKTYLATADVVNNQINFGADKVTFENRESRANMKPIPNSVWFAKMKNSKKSLYFGEYSDYFLKSFILSTGFAGLVCRKNFYLEYIWGIINNDHFETVKDRLANGATQEAINNDSMTFLPMIIPIDNILLEYHRKTFEMYKKIYLNQITNHKLAELRDWLLPMLMNGQVKVKS